MEAWKLGSKGGDIEPIKPAMEHFLRLLNACDALGVEVSTTFSLRL